MDDVTRFEAEQARWTDQINLQNNFSVAGLGLVAGVDTAYWTGPSGTEFGACCIVVVDYHTHTITETVDVSGPVTVPYIPGYLAFRELPLVLAATKKLARTPDLFMFDGNGYLHPRHMGIATHASFYLNKPTIGVAKTFYKVNDTTYDPPQEQPGSVTHIVSNDGTTYGAALRTRQGTKPIFISCGNWIDLDTAISITMSLTTPDSRIPLPLRQADLATHRARKTGVNTLHS